MQPDLALLQNISDTLEQDSLASQRKLAEGSGITVGSMNAVLKRFVERGWIMFTNVNKRKLAYALTPAGLEELARRGKTFALRTLQIANNYSNSVVHLFNKVRAEGKNEVILYGTSYIKFVFSYAAGEVGLKFLQVAADAEVEQDAYCIAGELNAEDVQKDLVNKGCISVYDIIEDDRNLISKVGN